MRAGWKVAARMATLLAALAFVGVALVTEWAPAVEASRRIGGWHLSAGLGLAVAGLGASFLAWRTALSALGSTVPLRGGARVFFVGQLGKYVPGSVWPVVLQADLAQGLGVPRSQTAAAFPLTLAVSSVTGVAVALVSIPEALSQVPGLTGLIAVPLVALGLNPRVIKGLASLAERVFRRPLHFEVPGWGSLLRIGAITLVMWGFFGLHLVALSPANEVSVGYGVVAVGAIALAWVAGILVVFVPAGAGVREVVLVVALGPVLGQQQALVVALLSRVILSVADVGLAAASSLLDRGGRLRVP